MKTFDEWFKDFTSWGLSQGELIQAACKPGDGQGDEVFTHTNGSVMTRAMCNRWLDFYSAASAGWNAAIQQIHPQ